MSLVRARIKEGMKKVLLVVTALLVPGGILVAIYANRGRIIRAIRNFRRKIK